MAGAMIATGGAPSRVNVAPKQSLVPQDIARRLGRRARISDLRVQRVLAPIGQAADRTPQASSGARAGGAERCGSCFLVHR